MANFEFGYMKTDETWRNDNEYFKKFKNVLSKFLKTDIKVVFHNPHGSSSIYSNLMDYIEKQLQIISWAYEKDYRNETSEGREVFRDLGLCTDHFYKPANKIDERIFSIDGCPLVVYNKSTNIVWLLWDASHNQDDYGKNSFNIIIKAFQYFAETEANKNIFVIPEISTKEIEYNKQINGLQVFNEKAINDMQNKLQNSKKKVSDMLSELTRLNRENNLLLSNIKTLRDTPSDSIDIMNKYVKHIEISNKEISIYTDHIYITDFDVERCYKIYDGRYDINIIKDSAWYIGFFKIVIDLSDWDIKFYNLNNRRRSYWSSKDNHPHVDKNGTGCLGDLTEMIAFATSNGDIATMVDVLIQYLQSANLDDSAGANAVNWDMVNMKNNTLLKNGSVFVEPKWDIGENEFEVA